MSQKNNAIYYKIIHENHRVQYGKTTNSKDLRVSEYEFTIRKKNTFGNKHSCVVIYDDPKQWEKDVKKILK